jgi:hypothetical protein
VTQIQSPNANIDAKTRTVLLTQPHPLIIGQEQKVLVPWAMMKSIVGKIIDLEGMAEAQTGDPRAVPAPPANPNGRTPP